jgi:hypothetical protein
MSAKGKFSADVRFWHLVDLTTVSLMSDFGGKADIRKCDRHVR